MATNGECRRCRLGSAKPRHPGSSPIGANTGTTNRIANSSTSDDTSRAANAESGAPSARFIAPVPNATASGMRMAAAYHLMPTRQRSIRLPSSRSPRRPSTTPMTTSAATSGPAAMNEPNGTVIHVSANATTKNTVSAWRRMKPVTPESRRSAGSARRREPVPLGSFAPLGLLAFCRSRFGWITRVFIAAPLVDGLVDRRINGERAEPGGLAVRRFGFLVSRADRMGQERR